MGDNRVSVIAVDIILRNYLSNIRQMPYDVGS